MVCCFHRTPITVKVSSIVALIQNVRAKLQPVWILLLRRTMAWPVGQQRTDSWPCVCLIGQTLIGLFWTAGHDTSHECCLWPNTNLQHNQFIVLWVGINMKLMWLHQVFTHRLMLHKVVFDVSAAPYHLICLHATWSKCSICQYHKLHVAYREWTFQFQ